VAAVAVSLGDFFEGEVAWRLREAFVSGGLFHHGDRGRTKIGVLKPIARSDSISSFCFASSN
jgi:hypothetical protein